MNGAQHFEPEKRTAAIASLLDYIRGASSPDSLYDSVSGLQFTAEQEALLSDLQKATRKDLHKIHFELALYRSARYAVASSYHTQVLGHVNGIRELYEGVRLINPLFQKK